ncbi:MAG: SMC-Scp complex subunit ScpB [Clostridium sp.]|nr:SMC-Scp complex subunit ScpB [Clostridium sp.]MCM1548113.1 SMC-Scp complex subunit ScpB [Ruminococcus sp.]
MHLNEKMGSIEAILFASGEAVDEFRLSEASGVEREELPALIDSLNKRYSDCESGIEILRLGVKYQMCTRKKYADSIKSAMESKRQTPLSQAAIEALTIVAYNQPVTKGFVESVRGIDTSSVVNSLVDKGLLEEDSRLDVPGHPVAYRTTSAFLRCFGLSSLDELPPLVRDDEVPPDDE